MVETKNTLYGNYLKAKKGENIKINIVSLNCFILYLSDGKYHSIEKYLEGGWQNSELITEYVCYFYSFYKHKILSFSLWIANRGEDYEVREKGFHVEPYHEILYSGTGKKKNNFLFINLTGIRDNYEDEFKLMAFTGTLVEPNLMLALFLGISSYGYPSSGEVVLLKKGTFGESEIKIVEQYLMLKRSRIRIRNENFAHPSNLRVKHQPVSLIEGMVGVYWVWNFDGKGNIVQSRFEINLDYGSRFQTILYGNNENNQVCLVNVSHVINRRICLSTHPQEGTGIIAYVILNISNNTDEINSGVFCSVGQNGKNPVSGKIALLRAKNGEEVIASHISKSSLPDLLKDNPRFNPLLKKLKEITAHKGFELDDILLEA